MLYLESENLTYEVILGSIEMKKVKLEVEIKVPDEANWFAFDKDGTPCWFKNKPSVNGCVFDVVEPEGEDPGMEYYEWGRVEISGWKKTLREVK